MILEVWWYAFALHKKPFLRGIVEGCAYQLAVEKQLPYWRSSVHLAPLELSKTIVSSASNAGGWGSSADRRGLPKDAVPVDPIPAVGGPTADNCAHRLSRGDAGTLNGVEPDMILARRSLVCHHASCQESNCYSPKVSEAVLYYAPEGNWPAK